MGFSFSPRMVTDSLVLYLDPANSRSYISGDTTWNDMSRTGGYMTLAGNTTFSEGGRGSIIFDGASGSYSTDSYTDRTKFMSNSFTTSVFIKPIDIDSIDAPGAARVYEKTGWPNAYYLLQLYDNSGSPYIVFNFTDNSGNTLQVQSAANTLVLDEWQYITTVVDRALSAVTIYSNGVNIKSNPIPAGFSDMDSTSAFRIPSSYAELGANFGALTIHEKALSQDEISQCYNTLKGRYPPSKFTTEGLVLNLDAGNTNSYISGDTTWYDLTTNDNDGNLSGGPTFDPTSGSSIVFDGTNDKINFGIHLSGSSISFDDTSFTIEHIIRPTGYQGTESFGRSNALLIKGAGATHNYFTQVLSADTVSFIKRTSPETIKFHSFTVPVLTDKIGFITFVINTSSSTVSCYHNGGLIETTALIGLPITSVETDQVLIGGTGNASLYFTGGIYATRVYNRGLTSDEVQQNYASQKSRYGL